MQLHAIPPASHPDASAARRTLSTEQAAAALHIKPQTLRAALCRDGHYAGVRPHKLPSRFLAWNAAEIDALVRGEVAA